MGQLQGTGLASKAYDFRLRFWDRYTPFWAAFYNASSSKVTSLRAAHAGRVLEPQKLQHFGNQAMSASNHLAITCRGCFVLKHPCDQIKQLPVL